ncbi:hypothetical protein HAZT_HAZT003891 [Hyalella azteca]|uniref:Helicase ATP-binding domain-containing protein n=1 Tax=Hyalella azteca TaxID=294128 RepID=A0A6A0H9C2_HYAAZ|nr:hypothetical protein HAZT_HAZT003891 [Hyalella azteca]
MNGEFLRVSDETCNKLKHIPCTAAAEETPAIAIDWEAKKREDEEHSRKLYEGLPPVKRDFYIEDPEVARLSKEEVAKIRFENRQISVSFREAEECLDAPNPVTTFRQAWQHFPDILELLEGRYEKPSPIQMQLWPVLLRGRDAIGIAQTGTGKTLAFLLPGLVNIQNQDPETKVFTGPRMIVIAPTRELALQIDDEVNKLQYSKIKRRALLMVSVICVCVYGQGDRGTQLRKLADGAMVVVATPGRLADLLRSQEVDLRRVSYVVFDEADRMLDMGFLCHLSLILNSVRKDRQFVMTSATWNSDIHHIAKFYLTDEIMVRVGERELKATYTVTQDVIVCEEDEKNAKLLEFLDTRTPDDKGLVFVNRRLSCEPLFSTIFEHFASKKRPLLCTHLNLL